MHPKRQKIEPVDAIDSSWLCQYLCIALEFDKLSILSLVATFDEDYRIAARARRIYTEWVEPLKRDLGLENHPLLLERTARSPFVLEFSDTMNPAIPSECTGFGPTLNVQVSWAAACESWIAGQALGELTSRLRRDVKMRLTTLSRHETLAGSLKSRSLRFLSASNSEPLGFSYIVLQALAGEHAVTVKCYSFPYRVTVGFRKASCPLSELEMSVGVVAKYESNGKMRSYGCCLVLDCGARKVIPACMVRAVNGHKSWNICDVILEVVDGYLEHAGQLMRYSVPVIE